MENKVTDKQRSEAFLKLMEETNRAVQMYLKAYNDSSMSTEEKERMIDEGLKMIARQRDAYKLIDNDYQEQNKNSN